MHPTLMWHHSNVSTKSYLLLLRVSEILQKDYLNTNHKYIFYLAEVAEC